MMPVRLPAAKESISTAGSQKRRRKWRRRAGGFLPFLREDDEAEEEEALVGRGSFEDIKVLLNQGRRARGGVRLKSCFERWGDPTSGLADYSANCYNLHTRSWGRQASTGAMIVDRTHAGLALCSSLKSTG